MTFHDPASPDRVGKYRFLASLGHGGMAEVFLAVALGPVGFNKLQVIKRLRPSLADDPDLCAMFLDEARLAARLNHKNVVQTNEVDEDDGQFFMAMEYLDGQPLNRVLGRAKQTGESLPIALALRIACEALQGLHYAHELTDYDGTPLGVVHRDVSPQNIFVTYDGQVKIVDFGIAKAARRVVETEAGVIKGKLAYMAPEQALSSSAEIDRRADVFSLGVVLWEMLAGRRLWDEMSKTEILGALIQGTPPLAGAAPGVDPELCRICDKAIAVDRDARYPTATALRADLERAGTVGSADDLGAFVEKLFHDQRAEIKAVLARQVDLVRTGAEGELLDLDRGSLPRRSRPSMRPPPSISETPPPSIVTPILVEGSGLVPAPPPAPPARVDAAEQEPRSVSSKPPAPRRSAPVLLGAAVVAAAASITYLVTTSGREPARPAPAPAANAVATPAPTQEPSTSASALPAAPAPRGAYIQVRLSANPASARILLDGAALPSNPFEGKLLKDGAVHRVEFQAGGFHPQSRLLVFDKDFALEVPLVPRPRVVAPAHSGSGSAPQELAEPTGMKPDPYQ